MLCQHSNGRGARAILLVDRQILRTSVIPAPTLVIAVLRKEKTYHGCKIAGFGRFPQKKPLMVNQGLINLS